MLLEILGGALLVSSINKNIKTRTEKALKTADAIERGTNTEDVYAVVYYHGTFGGNVANMVASTQYITNNLGDASRYAFLAAVAQSNLMNREMQGGFSPVVITPKDGVYLGGWCVKNALKLPGFSDVLISSYYVVKL